MWAKRVKERKVHSNVLFSLLPFFFLAVIQNQLLLRSHIKRYFLKKPNQTTGCFA